MRFATAIFAVAAALGFATDGFAQARHDEKPHGMTAPSSGTSSAQPSVSPSDPSEQTILLKDGGTLILKSDGTVYHADSKGRRVRMKDGVMMEATDGTKYMMKNDAIWRAITQKGTLHPSHQ